MDQLAFFTLLFIVGGAMGLYIEDYSWRDFEGIVPRDALPVGLGKNGKAIYIGQVLAGDKLIPGRIQNLDENIYFEHGEKAWSASNNVKIFCTNNPQNFKWVATTHREVKKLRDNLIVGGYEPNCTTYIGRVVENGKMNVGKVICNVRGCLALYVNDNGTYVEYHKFEILTYDPIFNFITYSD